MSGAHVEALLPAIQDAGPWLALFRKADYPGAFREYGEIYGEVYERALRETEPEALAEDLLDALEAGWRRQRPWNRSTVRMNEKQMIVVYLTPMLLESGAEDQEALAEALQRAWCARRPRETYSLGRFETLQGGFKTAIMGIPVGEWRER